MSALKSLIGVVICAGLVLGASLPAGAADANSDAAIPGLVDSAKISGPVVASGALSNDRVESVKGALVVLYAWPSGENLSRVAVGEAVKLAPVGFARADSNGRFDLRISDRNLLDKYRNAEGAIDFEIDGSTEDALYSYHFTADPSVVDAKKSGPSGVKLTAIEDIAPRVDKPELAPDGGAIEKVCTVTKVASLGKFWVNVGYGYVYGSGATMKFTYTSGSSSQLGVGVSSSGNSGTFSASGSSSFTSTSTVTYPSTASFKVWKTQFTWGKYKKSCTTVGAGLITTYQAKADGYAGGSSIQTVTGYPTASYCVPNAAGTSFTKATTAAYESSAGAGTSGVLGVNLSAKTGYSSTAKLTFSFTSAKQLCGTNGLPGGTPGRLVAR